MSNDDFETDMSRRRFLRVAAVTAVAATAAGAGAASLVNKMPAETTITTTTLPPNALLPKPLSATANPADELLLQLSALQAENARLQSDLVATQTRLNALETSNSDTKSDTEILRLQLSDSQKNLSLMAGLVALYEQLDAVDVGELLQDGLDSVGDGFAELFAHVPSLQEGIAAGRTVLDELDDHIPLLENGRSWLGQQLSKLHMYYDALERLLSVVVDAAGPFLQMFNEWVQKVLKWLPFGLGQKSSDIMNALTDMLMETPHLMNGLENNVAHPLDVWLGNANEEAPLRRRLIQPIKANVLDKATSTVAQAETVESLYRERVKRPVETAVTQRAGLHLLIDQYRNQHQI